MNIRNYPGFRFYLDRRSYSVNYDAWEALFCNAYIISIEGNFYVNVKDQSGYIMHVSIHHAMDYVKNYAIIKYFDEDQIM